MYKALALLGWASLYLNAYRWTSLERILFPCVVGRGYMKGVGTLW